MSAAPTRDQLVSGLKVLYALAEAIRTAGGPVALGPLYAVSMPLVDLPGFDKAIQTLVNMDLVRRLGQERVEWCGPVIAGGAE